MPEMSDAGPSKMSWKIAAAVVGFLVVAGIIFAVQRGYVDLPGGAKQDIASSTAPSLTSKVKYEGNYTDEVKALIEKDIADIRASLAQDYDQYELWLKLAIRYKMAGDLEKAQKVWEYIDGIHPKDQVTLHNLGDLNHNFYRNYPKAESYYLRAIEADQNSAIDYLALYDLYRYLYKTDSSAAEDILLRGSTDIQDSQVIDIDIALGNLYAQRGDKAEAVVYYRKARDAAQKVGDTQLVTDLNEAIEALSS